MMVLERCNMQRVRKIAQPGSEKHAAVRITDGIQNHGENEQNQYDGPEAYANPMSHTTVR